MLSVKNLTFKIIPVLAISAVLMIADVMINKPVVDVSTSGLLPLIPQQADVEAVGAKADSILALYQGFDVPVVTEVKQLEPEPTHMGLTQAQQEQQQGLLRELYINDEVYRLSAIVNQGSYIASLSVTNVNKADTSSRRLLLKTGDTLQHYTVVSVTARRITLRHEERKLWLQLFTPEQTTPMANKALLSES